MLHFIAIQCTKQHIRILQYTTLHHTTLHYSMYNALNCTKLHDTTVIIIIIIRQFMECRNITEVITRALKVQYIRYRMQYYNTYSTIQYTEAYWSSVHYSQLHCSIVQCTSLHDSAVRYNTIHNTTPY